MNREEKIATITNHLNQEYTAFKQEMLQESKEAIFNQAFKIVTYEEAQTFLQLYLQNASDRAVQFLESQRNLLFHFYQYFLELESGEVNKEQIHDFLRYEREKERKEEAIPTDKAHKQPKERFPYSELSLEAQEKAYQEALTYIEREYAEEEEFLKEKEKHARDEAENCALYYRDGSLAEII